MMEFMKTQCIKEKGHPSNDSTSIVNLRSATNGVDEINAVNETDETLLTMLFNDIQSVYHVDKSSIRFILSDDRIHIRCASCAKTFDNLFVRILDQKTTLFGHLRSKQHLKVVSRTEKSGSVGVNGKKNSALQDEILTYIFRDSYSLYKSNVSFIRFDKRKMALSCKVCKLSNFNVVSNFKGNQLGELVDHFKSIEHTGKLGKKKPITKDVSDSCYNKKLNDFSAYELSNLFLKHIPEALAFSSKYICFSRGQPSCSICCCVLPITTSDFEGAVYIHITGERHKALVQTVCCIRNKTSVQTISRPLNDVEVNTFFNETKSLVDHKLFIKCYSFKDTDDCIIYCRLCGCYILKNNVEHTLSVHINGRKHQRLFINSLVKDDSECRQSPNTNQLKNDEQNENSPTGVETTSCVTRFSSENAIIKLLKVGKRIQYFCVLCNRSLHCFNKVNLERHLVAKKHSKKLLRTTKAPNDVNRYDKLIYDDIFSCLPENLRKELDRIVLKNQNVHCRICRIKLFSIVDFKLEKVKSVNCLITHLSGMYHRLNGSKKCGGKDVKGVTRRVNKNVLSKLWDFKIKEYFYDENIPIDLYYNQLYIMVFNPKYLFCIACNEPITISRQYDYLFHHIINENHIKNLKEMTLYDIISIILNRSQQNICFNKYLDNIIYYLCLNKMFVIKTPRDLYKCHLCQEEIYVRSFNKLGCLFDHLFNKKHLLLCGSYSTTYWQLLSSTETRLPVPKGVFDDIIKNVNLHRRNMIENSNGNNVWTVYCKSCDTQFRLSSVKEIISHLINNWHSPSKAILKVENMTYLALRAVYDCKVIGRDIEIFNPELTIARSFNLSHIKHKIDYILYKDYLAVIKRFEACTYVFCILCNCVLVNPTIRLLIGHLTSIVHVRNIERVT